ncbi:quinol dehydrogenase ferredoxin subunit NapH [Rhodovibrionaceae bacterium A322]
MTQATAAMHARKNRKERPGSHPGRRARQELGTWFSIRFLVWRRLAQFFFLALFLTGPLFGVWITKGTLASSLTLDILPLNDPFIYLQELLAGHLPETTALLGAGIVLGAYLLVGGRAYCGWVCPINPVTDAAGWLRRKLDLRKGWTPKRWTRTALMLAVLAVTALTGSLAWELVNPITALHRSLIFGSSFGFAMALVIFLFDLFTAKQGWCGHLCPVGAFYGVVGKAAVLRVSAAGRARCDDCMDCFEVCPEPQVITPALRGKEDSDSPLILSEACLNCGRCIDVCSEQVFHFTHRFDPKLDRGAPSGATPQLCREGGR